MKNNKNDSEGILEKSFGSKWGMKYGQYVLVFEWTYRDKRYPLLTGALLDKYHSFDLIKLFK